MVRFSQWMESLSSGRVSLVALVLFLLFLGLVLPAQASRAPEAVSEVGAPDLSFYYTADDLYRMAEAYGEAGRRAYITARLTFDVVWPLVYTFFLATAISWVYRRASAPESGWRRANLLPVLAAVLDLLENASTSWVMARYPSPAPLAAATAGVFTAAKWLFVGLSFAALFGGLAAAVRRGEGGGA